MPGQQKLVRNPAATINGHTIFGAMPNVNFIWASERADEERAKICHAGRSQRFRSGMAMYFRAAAIYS
jgi:hypothetical protein